MDDETLGIIEDDCNACGLCVAACRPNAISIDQQAAIIGSEALLVCEKCDVNAGALGVACIHQLGIEQIADLYQKGVRKFVTASGDCDLCANGNGQRLDDRLVQFNKLLETRKLQPVQRKETNAPLASKWLNLIKDRELENSGRRKLFTSVIVAGDRDYNSNREQTAIGQIQQQSAQDTDPVFWFSPVFDEQKCDGCDSCVRICPQGALTMVNDVDGGDWYKILPQACNGCQLCVDVCSPKAVDLVQMKPVSATKIALGAGDCTSCGVRFHRPVGQTHEGSLCTICSQTRHRKNLFQVLG